MLIEDCTIGKLIMTNDLYQTRGTNFEQVKRLKVGKIIDYCFNACLEVIPVIEWFEYDFESLVSGECKDIRVKRTIGEIHHSSITAFDSEVFYRKGRSEDD